MIPNATRSAFQLCWAGSCALTLVVGGAGLLLKPATAQAPTPPTSPTAMDPKKVMGTQACIECHKPMIEAWQQTKHATEFAKLRENPNAKTYASAMGIAAAEITGNSVCASCHGQRAEGSAIKAITGVSCESCHGAAGGENGWLNPHGSYGAKGVTREQETAEHRAMRFALVDKAGMIRPDRDYLLARNCLECHLMVGHEDVVNKGGHHAGSAEFELVSWTHGEVDHNLFIDPKVNAKAPSLWMWRTKKTAAERDRVLYVVGKLAGMEVALRNVAASKTESSFSHAMAGHARDFHDDLSDINDAAKLPEIEAIVKQFDKYRRKVVPGNKAELTKFADTVAQTGIAFVKNHDGSKLAGLDSLIPTNVRGKRYVPK